MRVSVINIFLFSSINNVPKDKISIMYTTSHTSDIAYNPDHFAICGNIGDIVYDQVNNSTETLSYIRPNLICVIKEAKVLALIIPEI